MPKFLNAGKSAFCFPKNVLAWVLCYLDGGTPECKDEVGEARPVKTLNTNEGIQILCKSCSEKLERNVKRGENGTLLLRSCSECGTITAEDYKAIDDLTWLCIPCYEN